jgi:hypothetical protein
MMTGKTKSIICCALVLVGAVSLAYGLILNSEIVMPQDENDTQLLELSEPTLVRDVTVSGVKLDEFGRMVRTYTGQAPNACLT